MATVKLICGRLFEFSGRKQEQHFVKLIFSLHQVMGQFGNNRGRTRPIPGLSRRIRDAWQPYLCEGFGACGADAAEIGPNERRD